MAICKPEQTPFDCAQGRLSLTEAGFGMTTHDDQFMMTNLPFPLSYGFLAGHNRTRFKSFPAAG